MTPHGFTWLLSNLATNKDLVVFLSRLEKDQFHELIYFALDKKIITSITFDRSFLPQEKEKIYRIYISAFLQRRVHFTEQLVALAAKQPLEFQENLKAELFGSLASGDVKKVMRMLELGMSSDSRFAGRSLLHEVARSNYINLLQYLLISLGADADVIDTQGNYPLTIACRNGCTQALQIFFDAALLRYYDFDDQTAGGYTPLLDPLKIAIDQDNAQLLAFFLCGTSTPVFIEPTHLYLMRMHDYANEHKRISTQQLLLSYISTLRMGRTIRSAFDADAIRNLVRNEQGISKSDYSALASIVKLCKRYNIQIIENNGKRHLQSNTLNFTNIFNSLRSMIARAKSNGYTIYRLDADGNHVVNKILSDADFRKYAQTIFDDIAHGRDGNIGNYASWRSKWFIDGSEKLSPDLGLSVKESWALAIIAARDKHAIAGTEYDDQAIKDREQLLVTTLVECLRTYNRNNDQGHDMGGKSNRSCVHGVFLRPMLILSELHDDIKINTSAIGWASEIAEQTLASFYSDYKEKELFDHYRTMSDFQRNEEGSAIVNNFYSEAKLPVEEKLRQKLGMVNSGGYLFARDLQDILATIQYLPLPDAITTPTATSIIAAYTEDFTRIPTVNPVLGNNQQILEQFKLPATPDAFYAAILIAAFNTGINNPEIVTVQDLRNKVADVLKVALKNTRALNNKDFKALRKPEHASVAASVIRRMFVSLYPAQSKQREDLYVASIKSKATADSLVITIISALYDANINVYNIYGEHILTVNSQIMFMPPTFGAPALSLSMYSTSTSGKINIDLNFVNALVTQGAWPRLLPAFVIPNQQQFLHLEQHLYPDYTVMFGRNIAGFEQVKVAMHGASCFNAVLLAARHIGNIRALGIDNHFELRNLVVNEIAAKLLTLGRTNTDSLTGKLVEIAATAQSYLNNMLQVDTVANDLELAVMSELLTINIIVYNAEQYQPLAFNGSNYASSIHLRRIGDHYNFLVAANTWHGLGAERTMLTQEAQSRKRVIDASDEIVINKRPTLINDI